MTSTSETQSQTPAMRQYQTFKDAHPGYILMFRMGDFYEMFYEDAKIASRVLGLTLTSRSKGLGAIPLAGIPYHALDGYLARLVKANHRVAICEQVENPKEAKGVVKREVVRLITPGTLTDEHLLDHRQGNYLAAIFQPAKRDGSAAGVAWIELSSGAFWTMISPDQHVLDELVRIGPAEVLIAEGSTYDSPAWRESLSQCTSAAITSRPPWAFESHAAVAALNEHFATTTLEGFGFASADESISSAGAIIEYLLETQKTAMGHILKLGKFDRGGHMAIDGNTLRCLEVHRTLRTNQRGGSLLACIDETCTGMGARLLERWITFPLNGFSPIIARQDAVEEFTCDSARLETLRRYLSQAGQIDRISSAIAMGRVRPRELVTLAATLRLLPMLLQTVERCTSELTLSLMKPLTNLDLPADLIERAIDPDCPNILRDGGVIATGFNAELDSLRSVSSDGQDWLAQYQAQQAQELGVNNLKVGFNRVFGFYIELSGQNIDKAPPHYVRKQTLKNAERYITDELKQYESQALTSDERSKSLEADLFEDVRRQLTEFVPALQAAAQSLATLDVLAGLAQLAVERSYNRPEITQENILHITDGKHPVLAEQLRERFVPNDVTMDAADNRLQIITGPNMSGKSTYIRQTALLVLLAQTGSFIPARQARVGLVDRIFTRVGAADELSRGLSTFMLEMVETANILNNATSRSLVILDEVGRGTSTYDGLALAWAISEYIALKIKCRAMFATHYHELTELESLLDSTKNLNVSVREWADEVIFLHKIVEGGTDRSYGVHVAKLAGVPKQVLDRAKTILPQLQAHLAEGLDMPKLAKRAKQAADQLKLFTDPATKLAQEIKNTDLENLTPEKALELLKKLKNDL